VCGSRSSNIGPGAEELNVFQVDGNAEAQRQTPMFERGRMDHLGLQAASLEAFEEIRRRLIACGASDELITDFGPHSQRPLPRSRRAPKARSVSLNPDAQPGVFNPPETPAVRFSS
jgi:hypothetical protein